MIVTNSTLMSLINQSVLSFVQSSNLSTWLVVKMAANGATFFQAEMTLHRFTTVLSSAACEWFLIFLMLIDAALSYLLTKFAEYCALPVPCILCSRLDHVLGNEKPDFYRNLLCNSHRVELSSLIFCHIHGKLADGHGMCEDCLLSFTTKDQSNPDMQRLLVGKLGFDIGDCGFRSSFPKRDFSHGSAGKRICACCNKVWKSRQNCKRFLQLPSPGSGVSRPTIPLPRRLSRRDSLKKMRDKFSGSGTSCRFGKNGFDSLSHVGYTELKLTSDSESEVQFSDDDSIGANVVRDISKTEEESKIRHAQETSSKALPGDVDSIKSQRDAHKPQDMKIHTSDVSNGYNLVEKNCLQDGQKAHPPPALPELISLDGIPPLSSAVEVPVGLSTEKYVLKTPFSQNTNPSAISELLSLVDSTSCFTVGEVPVGVSTRQNISGTSEIIDISIDKHEVILKSISTTAEAGNKRDQAFIETSLINPSYTYQSDKCESAIAAKERQILDPASEKSVMSERERVDEELKQLPAQHNGGGIDLSSNTTNPNVPRQDNKLQVTDASSSTGLQMLTTAVSMERTESLGHESLDGSVVSDIEGESIVDKFKRQVDYDRKCINALYKELEEERSASAIAANQAMAMITRLQAEKASLHMEALQYLRMMEEQAEYDVEALEKANDLLAEKEKEIQDLEAELEYFRLKFLDEYAMESTAGEIDPMGKNINIANESESCITDAVGVPCKLMSTKVSNNGKKVTDIQSAWSEFEDEKLYISECLKNLESRVRQLSHRGASNHMPDSRYSEAAAYQGNDGEEIVDDNGFRMNGQMAESNRPMQNIPTVSNTGHSADNEQRNFQKDNDLCSTGQNSFSNFEEIDVVALENEISDLNERLEALEADCNLIEHILNALQDGNEGVKYIHEIAHQLQKLRKIGRESKCQSVT